MSGLLSVAHNGRTWRAWGTAARPPCALRLGSPLPLSSPLRGAPCRVRSLAKSSAVVAEATPGDVCAMWKAMKDQRPLVQCITNYVSMDLAANLLLAAGASPAMVHSTDEVEEFCSISSGLLINVGTLSSEWVAAMKITAHKANATETPWILDPVGAGATQYRTKACVDILNIGPTVLRGNASEILALAGAAGSGKGVDSTASSDSALEAAKAISKDKNCVVAVSGATDYVTDGSRVVAVENGVPMLCDITATGCSVTALIAAFVAANKNDPLLATASALAVFGLSAELGSKTATGPGSLRVNLLDTLYGLSAAAVLDGVKISEQ